MSNFKGIMKEYPFIAADYFKGKCLEPIVSAYILSHCHRDHMEGLNSPEFLEKLNCRKNVHLYCTSASACLLRNDQRYKHLEPHLVPLEYNEPKLLALYSPISAEVLEIVVTFLPAGHCVGSAMILIEGKAGNVLYTGDIRIGVGEIQKFEHLHTGAKQAKQLKSIYLDTTFCRPAAFYIPSRLDSLDCCVKLIQPWLDKSPSHSILIICPAQYGYEHLFLGLYKQLGMKIYVGSKKFARYDGLPSIQECLTPVSGESRIALWVKRDTTCQEDGDGGDSDDSCSPRKDWGQVLKIKLSAMWYTRFKSVTEISRCLSENFYRVCYSTHCSLQELQDMIAHLQPENIYPNVVGTTSPDQMVKWLRVTEEDVQSGESEENAENVSEMSKPDSSGDYVPFGRLNIVASVNGTGDDKGNGHDLSSGELDFGSSPCKLNQDEMKLQTSEVHVEKFNDTLQGNHSTEKEDSSDGKHSEPSLSQVTPSQQSSRKSISDQESADDEPSSVDNSCSELSASVDDRDKEMRTTSVEGPDACEVVSSSPKWHLNCTPSDGEEILVADVELNCKSVEVSHLDDGDSLAGPAISEVSELEQNDRSTCTAERESTKVIDVITYNSDEDNHNSSSCSEIDVETLMHQQSDSCRKPIITYPEDDTSSAERAFPVEGKERRCDTDSVLNSNNASSIVRVRTDFQSNSVHRIQGPTEGVIDLSNDIEVIHEVTVNNHISSVIGSSSQIFHFNIVNQSRPPEVFFDVPSSSTSHTVVTTSESSFSLLKRSSSLDETVVQNSIKRRHCFTEEYEQACTLLGCSQTNLMQNSTTLNMLQTSYNSPHLNLASDSSSSSNSDKYSNDGSESANVHFTNELLADNRNRKRNDSRSSSDILCLTNSSSEDLDVVGNGSSQVNHMDASSKEVIELIELDDESNSLPKADSNGIDARCSDADADSVSDSTRQSDLNCVSDSDATPEKMFFQGNGGDNARSVIPRKIFNEDPSSVEVITIDD